MTDIARPKPLAEIGLDELEGLARAHGTPFFIYDADAVNERITRARAALGGAARVYYAVKANPNLELLRAVRQAADGLDLSSGGELEQALLAGFEPGRLSFAGPAKTAAELERAIEAGVGCISVESQREIDECARLAGKLERRANIGVRVNPKLLNRAFGLKMGGRAVQFGIDEEALGPAMDTIRARGDRLAFQGIHIYAGSQCFEPQGVIEGVQNTFRIAREVERDSALHCSVVNVGGGFGVSHTEAGRELDVNALGKEIIPILREFHAGTRPREIVFELGRWLTADAGIYVTRVVSSKGSRGKTFFVLDGGLHHHLAAAGTFGAAFRGNYLARNLTRPDAPPVTCSLAGPSCNPTDLLGIDVELAQPEHGDLVGILKSGSYSFTASPLLFLGRQTPAEIVRHGGRSILGRRPRSIVDFN